MQGCVSRFSGDYILMKQNPAMTYELQATGKTKLRQYLGQRVEVTGREVAVDEHKLRCLNQNGFRSLGDHNHRFDQDNFEAMHGAPGL